MITVREAQALILKNSRRLGKTAFSVSDSAGYVIAEGAKAPIALPLYNNSAMDGFALRSRDTRFASDGKAVVLKIRGVIKAGDLPQSSLKPFEAYKIMTGAMIPPGGDVVLPKEEAVIEENRLILRDPLFRGTHIRYQGEELKKGARVLRKFAVIHPGTVGFLASLGRDKIKVFRKPQVSVITTGNELTKPGRLLKPGKIYDSNSVMISSALKTLGIKPFLVKTVQDKPGILRKVIRKALEKSDVLILTGGVSVGDYDYVREILAELGVRSIFWKVSQKPGKPIYFGRKGRSLIFGLPGNPASVFTCFYEYVYPAIRLMSGFRNPALPRADMKLSKTVRGDPKKLVFLKARAKFLRNGKVATPLPHQGSHMISSLCDANSLALIPPNSQWIKKGQEVTVHLLPFGHGDFQ